MTDEDVLDAGDLTGRKIVVRDLIYGTPDVTMIVSRSVIDHNGDPDLWAYPEDGHAGHAVPIDSEMIVSIL